MRYGFIIDNRKCIGCHACTTACKSEHRVPVGVNRTWVKQVEKGEFPHTRRLFSVMRCNHCSDAPCVEICPVEALFIRPDGIVDFDKERCIGCKSCMQACPYDALYIDPETHTAAKCNYCAHRIDIGLEAACVNVCPEHAIISGDMDNAETEIAQLLAREPVKARKPEKGTVPNLFYIDADDASLVPMLTERSDSYLWSQQELGVGHYAREAERMAFSNGDVLAALMTNERDTATAGEIARHGPARSADVLLGKPRRVYDTPNKGILWGWEVSAYVWTKAIAAGAFLVPFFGGAFGWSRLSDAGIWTGLGISLLFLMLTGLFLVKDLDQPRRFLYVLLRAQWRSWLVRGGYAITAFGGLLTLLAVAYFFGLEMVWTVAAWLTMPVALLVAVYTAFLFAQARGRDFWQSPALALHMLLHSLLAGGAVFLLLSAFQVESAEWVAYLRGLSLAAIGLNLLIMLFELTMPHPTEDARIVAHMITHGRYARRFYFGVLLVGNVLPALLLLAVPATGAAALAGGLILLGIYLTETIWVEAPQRIALS